MKTLALGDIHGRDCWKQIIEKEAPDRVIFLGDFITTHELYSEDDQLQQLREILEYKRQHPNTIILRGNHDLDGLGYYWAGCYPAPGRKIHAFMDRTKPLGQEFLRLTQWIHVEEIGGKPYIAKMAVDESYAPGQNDTNKKFYHVRAIKIDMTKFESEFITT